MLFIQFSQVSIILAVVLSAVFIGHLIANFRLGRSVLKMSLPGHKETLHLPSWQRLDGFSFRRTGLYLGIALGAYAAAANFVSSVFVSDSMIMASDASIDLLLNMASLFIFMFTALFLADKALLPKIQNDREIRSGNSSVGISEGFILLSTGLVAHGSILGEGPIWTAWFFFLCGQLVFIVVSMVFEMQSFNQTAGSVKSGIELNNVPSGVLLGSILLSSALLISNAISGDFHSLEKDLTYFAFQFGSGIVALMVYVLFLEKVLVTKVFNTNLRSLYGALIASVIRLLIVFIVINHISL